MAPQPPHPLRRISTGSLSTLARSQDRSAASPSGLDFLGPAMMELADEAATLAANIEHLNEMHDALGTFNESFAAWMYALKMNAFCVEWPQAPSESTYSRLPQLEEAMAAVQKRAQKKDGPTESSRKATATPIADMTYKTETGSPSPPPRKSLAPKKSVAAGPSAAAKKAAVDKKKRRMVEISGYIDMLPLEYRGAQPAQRQHMETIINKLMDKPAGAAMKDLLDPPQLPQAKVNKCLIALVGKKLVVKENVGGATWYKWVGV
ncbi:DASH complex subunit Dam1-domain-containing protein [Kockovaella imperatae]|uniref:DASH complex subunit DAM1 n=1 Tax=Kockovaella imperatae TaxID=4999 RepID=A0A1Y1UIN7_9TREE|nr:DASH complex subunit Dam1-domain-containing protein [Kockovaella imperatae]ORX37862.1 DASH complex subunit Dam1-domain-containing protein [Kockovaella imperatae]